MLFALTKILGSLAQPTSALLLLLVWACWVRYASFGKRGNKRMTLILGLFLVAAFTPLSNWVILPLEERFPRPLLGDTTPIAGIIVLGGFLDADASTAHDRTELLASGDRIIDTAVLARRIPDVPIVITGGSAAVLRTRAPEAEMAKQLLVTLGITAGRIKPEIRSRTTAENATMTRELLIAGAAVAPGAPLPGRFVLVTSAMHMPRAVGTFRKAGFDVVPYPIDYRSAGPADRWTFFQQPSRSLNELDNSSKEWFGLLVYWLRGDSEALFPAP